MAKRILFLMSDTGGGHRAAAEAIRDAMIERYGADTIEADLVDVYRQMDGFSKTMPEFYPWIVTHGKALWTLAYKLTNSPENARFASRLSYFLNGNNFRKMVEAHPADVVVGVHSVTFQPTVSAFLSFPQRPPIISVVTDLVTTPYFWYDPRVEFCFVPTQQAFERGLMMGLKPQQMAVSGLPVHPNFQRALMDKTEARVALNWDPNLPTILMTAGGDGTGPVYEMAQAIVNKKLNCQIAIVAGKNKDLKARLDEAAVVWNKQQPVHVFGYVTTMPRLMAASDIMVAKAGPATICEACIAGLPIILSDAIPGQEAGNIDYVVTNGVGIYAPYPDEVAAAVAGWLAEGEEGLRQRSERAKQLARPDAVYQITELVWEYAHQAPIINPQG